jgi:phosphoribosyl 1,2-cyclic phosphate phosphodiesterase
VVLTGTGTSQGVPVIGCDCPVCGSPDPRDKRLRSAVFLQSGITNIAVDAGPDFRQQMLRLRINHLDALLLTHEHNDHVAGLDDIRPFNFLQKKPLKVFALPNVAKEIRNRFKYIFAEHVYPGAPQIQLIEMQPYQILEIGQVKLMPFLVTHGLISVLGFRSGDFVYITDANDIPSRSSAIISGAKIMILNALHHKAHHSHFNLQQAIFEARKHHIGQTYLTHVSHQMGTYAETSLILPDGVSLAYDEMTLEV